MACLGGKWIALELVGTQYNAKSAQPEGKRGRKALRDGIVRAYGVRVVEVNSDGLRERTISSFRNQV